LRRLGDFTGLAARFPALSGNNSPGRPLATVVQRESFAGLVQAG
jgi:hypothetical protein